MNAAPGARRAILLAVALTSGAAAVGAAERSLNQSARYPFTEAKRVVIELTDHDVEVRFADIDEIRTSIELAIAGLGSHKADSWIAAHTPEVTDGPGELRIACQPAGTGFLAFGYLTASARLRVLLPNGAVPDITTSEGAIRIRGDYPVADPLRLRTAAGSVSFEGAAPSIDVRTVSGDIKIDVLRPLRSLFARTASGNVTLTGGARAVEADTASGNVRLDHLSGSATVATTTGRISMRWNRFGADQRATIQASSGSVVVTIPSTADPGGTITTTGGAIRCDISSAVRESEQTVRLTGPTGVVDVETASGSVVLAVGDSWEPAQPP